jgi:hypothetical protein
MSSSEEHIWVQEVRRWEVFTAEAMNNATVRNVMLCSGSLEEIIILYFNAQV